MSFSQARFADKKNVICQSINMQDILEIQKRVIGHVIGHVFSQSRFADKKVKLSINQLQDILEIHKRVIGHVDPVEAGLFRCKS
jgi:hypothetical protein